MPSFKTSRCRTACVLIALSLVVCTPCRAAAVISLAFNDGTANIVTGDTTTTTGSYPYNPGPLIFTGQTGEWNLLNTGNQNETLGSGAGPTADLIDGSGTTSTVQFAITSSFRSAPTTLTSLAAAHNELAYLYPQAGLSGNYMDFQFTGLNASANYELILYGGNGGLTSSTSATVGGVTALYSSGNAYWGSTNPIESSLSGSVSGSFYYASGTPGFVGLQLLNITVPSLTWNGGGGTLGALDGSGTWSNTGGAGGAANWWSNTSSSTTTWSDGNGAIFGAGSGTAGTVTISGSVLPNSITFNAAGSGSYTLSGGTINLGGGSEKVTPNVNATIGSTIANGTLNMLGPATLYLTGSNSYAGGTLVSGGTLNVNADAALGAAAGAVTFTGSGTLQAGAAGLALNASRGIILSSGTATLDAAGQTGFSVGGVISGSGSLAIKTGGQMVVLSNVNTYTGATTVNSGTLSIGNGGSGASIASTSGVALSNGANINFNHSDAANFAGSITGSGSLTKTGAGTLTITGTQGYSGSTLISGGMLKLQSGAGGSIGVNFIGGGGSVTGSDGPAGAVMSSWNNLSGANPSASNLINSSGVATTATVVTSGAAGTASTGASSDALLNGYIYQYQAAISVTLGSIPYSSYNLYAFSEDSTAGHTDVLTLGGSTYYFTAEKTSTFDVITNTNSASFPNGNYVVATGLSGSSQTVAISSANGQYEGFSGFEIVNASPAGALNLLPVATPLTIAASAALDLGGGSQQVASLSDFSPGSGGSVISSNTGAAAILTLATSGAATFSGLIQGGGTLGAISLVMSGSGTQVLAGANTYTGGTTIGGGVLSVGLLANGGSASGIGASTSNAGNLVIDGGTLQYTGGAASTNRLFTIGPSTGAATINASGSGPLIFSSSGVIGTVSNSVPNTLTLQGASTAANSFTPSIQDPPNFNTSLVKSGSGTWILTGQSQYSGTTTVSAGKLVLAAGSSLDETAITVAAGATLAPQPSSGTISTTVSAEIPGGASLTLLNGSNFNMTDNAVGCFNLQAFSALGSTSLTLGGATLTFDLSGTGADQLLASWGTASVSGVNTIDISAASGLAGLASSASYPLIVVPGGGLNSGGSFALGSGTIQAGSNVYDLSLTTASGGTAELLDVALASSSGTPGLWTTTHSGSGSFSWGAGGNWSNGLVPTSGTVTFAGSPGTPITVTLDGPQSAGALAFNSAGSNSYTLAAGSGGTLTLSTSSSAPSISVYSGSQTISAPLEVSGGSLAVALSSSGVLAISGNISDDGGRRSLTLEGDGSGKLILSGTNTYGGGTNVEAGTLLLNSAYALPSGSSLTVGDAAAFAGTIISAEAPALAISAVPEPGTLALAAAAALGAIAVVKRKRLTPRGLPRAH